MIYDTLETEVAGALILAADERGLRHLNFINGRHPIAIAAGWRRAPEGLAAVKTQLAEYFSGERRSFDVDLAPEGTPFQMKVWAALRDIPYGRVVSYQWIARRIGSPGAERAVGAANGRNPISIIIPCHRVIGKNGSLTGYGGGLDAKRRLIRLENPETPLTAQAPLPFSGR
ncbi:methylated-DNA--protein-cysteine methyltransferase [Desulfosarcina alkanivorans]|uniref:Methylated-DNA--protein-cysteine methyltransferase n=1 Tax=Desulfosarcina alkanivorans TaxID=571177 RepID=A0A5K7YNE0_9BACT|nr:methylated-DNA--[protein]-cysteine S-methyltransferase [Desulfosarcina alkanivorans]BBO70328.1 methylated-DNA--protein-cysteine methyltransferase [Desulfosarcina alkanivorans]